MHVSVWRCPFILFILTETYCVFDFSFLQCFIYVLVHVKDLESKKKISSSLPQKTMLLKRLVIVPPLILWLCDITPCHTFVLFMPSVGLVCKNWFSTALLFAAGSGVCELTNQRRRDIQEGGFKETGAKTECFRQRGSIELQHWGKWCVFWALNQSIDVILM